ncbi:MAG: hypothetical protein ACOC0D_04445 [Spirochaeta sp.]
MDGDGTYVIRLELFQADELTTEIVDEITEYEVLGSPVSLDGSSYVDVPIPSEGNPESVELARIRAGQAYRILARVIDIENPQESTGEYTGAISDSIVLSAGDTREVMLAPGQLYDVGTGTRVPSPDPLQIIMPQSSGYAPDAWIEDFGVTSYGSWFGVTRGLDSPGGRPSDLIARDVVGQMLYSSAIDTQGNLWALSDDSGATSLEKWPDILSGTEGSKHHTYSDTTVRTELLIDPFSDYMVIGGENEGLSVAERLNVNSLDPENPFVIDLDALLNDAAVIELNAMENSTDIVAADLYNEYLHLIVSAIDFNTEERHFAYVTMNISVDQPQDVAISEFVHLDTLQTNQGILDLKIIEGEAIVTAATITVETIDSFGVYAIADNGNLVTLREDFLTVEYSDIGAVHFARGIAGWDEQIIILEYDDLEYNSYYRFYRLQSDGSVTFLWEEIVTPS